MLYNADTFDERTRGTQVQLGDKWYVARPERFTGIFARIGWAWLVLKNKADAIQFEQDRRGGK
jgi:hypothetical protein